MKQMMVYLIVLAVVSIGVKQVFGVASKSFVEDYDKKVCNNELTCNLTLTPGLEEKKLTFDGRDCMCDAECPKYNDCCRDSPYIKNAVTNPKNYTCHPTMKVYVIFGCPADTKANDETQQKCNEAFEPLHESNTFVITPVTNTKTNVTYASSYCALCNGDDQIDELWTLTAGCGVPMYRPSSPKPAVNFLPYNSKLDQILPNVTYNATSKQMEGHYNNKTLLCEFNVEMPKEMAAITRKCVPNMVTSCPNNAEGTKKCQSYIAVVYDSSTKKAYRNRDCALCNGVKADLLSGCPSVATRTGASTLFSGADKSAGSESCSNPIIAAKFC